MALHLLWIVLGVTLWAGVVYPALAPPRKWFATLSPPRPMSDSLARVATRAGARHRLPGFVPFGLVAAAAIATTAGIVALSVYFFGQS